MRKTRLIVLASCLLWLAFTAAWFSWPVEHGLRAQYFPNAEWTGRPALTRVDPQVSTARLYNAWRTAPPETFSVQWSGYLDVPRDGNWTFTIEADNAARFYIDNELIIDIADADGLVTGAVTTPLSRGAHRVVLHYAQRGGSYALEWFWAAGATAREPVPFWALTPRQPGRAAIIARWIEPAWWVTTVLVLAVTAIAGMMRAQVCSSRPRLASFAARVGILSALGGLLLAGATEHARVVNNFKARGDQSGYLGDAQMIYANWNGRTPALLVGERMRMPLYAGFLALAYTPRISDDEFFEVAKTWNIRLALVLLAALALLFAWHLPPLSSFNLTLIVAFGYWAFKAGYSQPELLFYFFFFGTFVACLHLFRPRSPWADVGLGALAGALAGLAFLTKALVPPFVALFLAAYSGHEAVRFWNARKSRDPRIREGAFRSLAWRAAAGLAMAAAFLVVVGPYILNSKRVFGQYFYNANTTYFIWYDDGAEARAIMMPRMDVEGRISMPPDEMPSMGHYLRTRSAGQIASRLSDGFANIIVRSYETYWYFWFVLAYLSLAAAVIASNWREAVALARQYAFVLLFLFAYAGVYLAGTAFFSITSSTGTTRFFITHLTPFFFSVSWLLSREPFSRTRWRVAGLTITTRHAQIAITSWIAAGLAFWWWPRMITTYGGF
jgi:hypothetical protein